LTFLALDPQTDAGKMALLAAFRRDWRPPPATQDYGPAMQQVLFEVAVEIEMEATQYFRSVEESPL
jgi:hypothetical protein